MLNINDIAFFGRSIETFQELLLEQAQVVFERAGIIVPVRSCSLMLLIQAEQNPSAADLARKLGYSHQLVLQKIPKLIKLDLITTQRDPADKRRKIYAPAPDGLQQIKLLETVLPAMGSAYSQLFDEVGDLNQLLSRLSDALREQPLEKRVTS